MNPLMWTGIGCLLLLAAVSIVAWTVPTTPGPHRPRWYRGTHRDHNTGHAGATMDSPLPRAELDAACDAELTPTGLLPRAAPVTLDDGTVVGQPDGPSWAALDTDTHRAIDPAWTAMTATFRSRMDAITAALEAPRTVDWYSGGDTGTWDAAELRAELATAS